LFHFQPQLLQLTVSGVFKERRPSGSIEHIRSFQRTLVIVPAGSGFCIRNEMVHINNATAKQEKFAFKMPMVAAAAPVPVQQQQQQHQMPTTHHVGGPLSTIPETVVTPATPDDATKMQMLQAMCATSHMNMEWSRKCLEEHQWDYQRAGATFTHLHSQQKIPPEAFAK
jgi:nuclear RNA export factor